MIAFAYYLLKLIICSGILFLYYHIALRNKLFHQWNRFYLLLSILISLIVPLVQVNILHPVSAEPNKAIQVLQVIQSTGAYFEGVRMQENGEEISVAQWLVMMYSAISLVLLFSVLLSLKKLLSLMRSHSIQWAEKVGLIITKAEGTPFSFFNFIFWNENISLHTETGQQIFQHELVHVKEKHTLDKLAMQILLIFFWCNPFFWLIRRELKLIHEFIADKKAVGEQGTAALAAMILHSSYPSQFNSITNHFFQTSIKRRLIMLTKIQNPKINYLSRILALPILALTVLAFTLRTKHIVTPGAKLDKQITVVIDAGHGIMPNGKPNGVAVGQANEDDIVFSIASKIKELNKNDGLKIVLTRTSGKLIDLNKRVDIAKENKADLFVSLHINAYVENANPDLSSDQSLKSGFGIYVSNKQPVYQAQSEKLGSVLSQELNSIYPTNPYLLKRKVGVWVLDQNICPSVLIECGFLTDEKDRKFISSEANQTAIAQKILVAVERYALNGQETQNLMNDTVPPKQGAGIRLKNDKPNILKPGNAAIAKSGVPVEPLYILEGKEVAKDELGKVDPAAIQSIKVLSADSATTKYGRKGENGVLEIQLKPRKDAVIAL